MSEPPVTQHAVSDDPAPPRDRPQFTPAELRLFRYTAVLASSVILAGLVAVIVWVLAQVLTFFYNLIMPLAVAGVLALVLYPVVDFFQRRLHMPRVPAVAALFVAVLAVLGVGLALVVPTAISQTAEFIEVTPKLLANWEESLQREFPRMSRALDEALENRGMDVMLPGFSSAGVLIMSYVGLFAGLAFVPLFLYFALVSGNRLRATLSETCSVFSTNTQREIVYLGGVFVEYVTAFFQGQLIIAMSMGALLAFGFTMIGLQAAIVLGLLLGILNIVPYLGTIIGLLITLPVAWLQPEGGIELVALTLLIFAAVQGVESLFLTPTIMANRSGLHPALVVISIFFWGTVFDGVIGMILAVPLTAFVVTLWHHFKASVTNGLSSSQIEVQPTHGTVTTDSKLPRDTARASGVTRR